MIALSWAFAGCSVEEPPVVPAGRSLWFEHRSWDVHRSAVRRGAGPNRWSDSEEAVDVSGRWVTLALTRDAAGWLAAELSTPLARHTRRIRFELDAETLDTQVVAGVFVYRHDGCEIDFELSRWADPSALPFQFALSSDQGVSVRRVPGTIGRSSHVLRWRRRAVTWISKFGGRRFRWRVRGDGVVPFRSHRLHLNLWLIGGDEPEGNGAVHVRVGRIEID